MNWFGKKYIWKFHPHFKNVGISKTYLIEDFILSFFLQMEILFLIEERS